MYYPVIIAYAVAGVLLAAIFCGLSSKTEAQAAARPAARLGHFGIGRSGWIVVRLSALFALDAFGGGFVVQAVMVVWFRLRFGVEPAMLGTIFAGANVLAGLSSLAAAMLARRIGLVNTMVFTHLPSNVLLMLVPLMPELWMAVALLWLRFSISQMDVPTRQSYTMAVVTPEERAAAAGITTVVRSIGLSISTALGAQLVLMDHYAAWVFYLAGGIKIVYDLLLYWSCITVKPPEEG